MEYGPDSTNTRPTSTASAASRISAALQFCLFTTFSTAAGFAPLVLFLGKPYWLIWISAIPLIISLAIGWRLNPANERPLVARESVVVIFSSVSDASIMAMMLFLVYGVVWGIGWLIGLVGWSTGSWVSIGKGIVGFLSFFSSLGTTGVTAEKIKTLLFPSVGIGNAPLVPDMDPGQISPKAFLATVLLAGMVSLSIFSSYFLIPLQICLAMTSLPAAQRLRRRRLSRRNIMLRNAVKSMLRALDYVVMDRLQTGQLKMDRLISVFDVVAHAKGYALAIQLKTEEEGSAPVTGSEAGYLKSATRPVYFALRSSNLSVHTVLPMLVLCGRASDETLTTFAREESIIVAKTDWTTVENIAGNKLSSEEIRDIAQSQLSIRPAHRAAEATV